LKMDLHSGSSKRVNVGRNPAAKNFHGYRLVCSMFVMLS
jgi:hypothetical protein